jgi:hypothetical protein
MKRSFLNIGRIFMPFGIAFSLIACTTDDETPVEGESRVTLRGTAQESQAGAPNSRVVVGAFAVSEFQVGSQDVEMSYAAKSQIGAGINLGNINLSTNINAELGTSASQPKTNVLIANGEHQVAVIGEGRTPDGTYTEITFDLHQNTTAPEGDFARGKSLYIIGEINNTPARIWFEAEESLRATAQSAQGYQIEGNTDLWLYFNMDQLFANTNFSAAQDLNGDGIIDIGPNNVDGNGTLHTSLRSNLSSSVEFVK